MLLLPRGGEAQVLGKGKLFNAEAWRGGVSSEEGKGRGEVDFLS